MTLGRLDQTSAATLDPFTDEVYAIASHYGVRPTDVDAAPAQGQVNLTVFLGAELVLRIPRKVAAHQQLAKEAEVIPLVQDAGVPTTALVSYDASLHVAPVPYIVLERLHGTTLAQRNSTDRQLAHRSLGEILVALHQIRLGSIAASDAVPAPFTFSAPEVVQDLMAAGEIGSAQADWLLEQFALLKPAGPSQADPVLIHRDVTASNVIVDRRGRVTALFDWGCAEWGTPARDLVGLPLRALPDLLIGYRSALRGAPGQNNEPMLERDALWFHLYLALARLLKEPSTSEDRNWAAPRQATLLDILAFISTTIPHSWPELLGRLARDSRLDR